MRQRECLSWRESLRYLRSAGFLDVRSLQRKSPLSVASSIKGQRDKQIEGRVKLFLVTIAHAQFMWKDAEAAKSFISLGGELGVMKQTRCHFPLNCEIRKWQRVEQSIVRDLSDFVEDTLEARGMSNGQT